MRKPVHVRSDNLKKKNLYLALTITLLALTFVFYPGTEGMAWMMWRDAPLLASALAAAAAIFAIAWWRTPRS
jgi:uncharacterized membrane protein YccC